MIYKLIFSLGLLELMFQHPLFVALCGILYFIKSIFNEEDIQTMREAFKSWPRFIKRTREISKEAELPYDSMREFSLNMAQVFAGSLSKEHFESMSCNTQLMEYFLRCAKVKYETERSWRPGNLHDLLYEQVNLYLELKKAGEEYEDDWEDDPDHPWASLTLLETYERQLELLKMCNYSKDLTEEFTEKDFRQLRAKLKVLGRGPDGAITNQDLNKEAQSLLEEIEPRFRIDSFGNQSEEEILLTVDLYQD